MGTYLNSEVNSYINEVFRIKLKELTIKLEGAQTIIRNHNLSRGVIGEEILRDYLRSIIPKRFCVSQGFIISNNGLSRQCDIVIYDNSITCPLYSFGNIEVIPIEGVKAVIEVKTSINKKGFISVLQSFRELSILCTVPKYLFVFDKLKTESIRKWLFSKEAYNLRGFKFK